jgi:translation initiation factor 3 subunit C
MMLVSARFDFNPGTSTYQSTDLWLKTQAEINQIAQLLEQNRELTLSETVQTLLDDAIDDADPQSTVVRGSLISHVSRLDDEFNKSLQNTDTHTMEYVDRLKDELSLYALIVRTERYYESLSAVSDSLALVKLLRLNHIYAKVH